MVLHNPNNWHWVNKDVSPWAREYLQENLCKISAERDGVSVHVDQLLSMEGDVDVSQRKGKVITLFDVKLRLEYAGKTSSGDDVTGNITIPEVAHDTAADEYVFEIDVQDESSSKQPVKDLVREKVVPQIRERLQELAPALIEQHGKDIQHAAHNDPRSTSKPSTGSVTNNAATRTTSIANEGASGSSIVNVTTVNNTEEFRTTAAELFKVFTDPQRIAAFTRSPPKVFEGARTGCKFELFDGNVSGEFVELQEPTKVVQRWRLAQWPANHFSHLEIKFDQNDRDAVTIMRVNWTGVPIGQEEVTRRNWGEYYVRSIKTTFGFGTVL